MRKLIEASFVSLDGIVESPQEWALPFFNVEENKQHSLSRLMECDAFLMGRETFQLMQSIGSAVHGDPYFDKVGSLPKYVASTTLQEVSWNASLLKNNVADEITRLKSQPGKNLMKYGNGSLDETLIAHNLIDEFHFSIIPVAVGQGRRLFEDIDTSGLNLQLISLVRFSNGVITVSYART